MRILILGAGKMGSFFTDVLSFQHETAVFDVDPKRLRFVYNTYRYTTLEEIEENAIIISEGDHLGKIFFKDLYQNLGLNIFEYTFEEHDETVAYSLSIPFVSTFVFAAVMKHQDAPGTTFKRHMKIAKGVLNEDDYLLQEILFNPRTPAQVEGIRTELNELLDIINKKDAAGMRAYLSKIREKIK